MSWIEPTVRYLESTVKALDSTNGPNVSTLHGMYQRLHRVTGLYWIVCCWKLLEQLRNEGCCTPILEKFRASFFSIINDNEWFDVNQNGGPLRCLSRAQLCCLLLDRPEDEGMKNQELETLGNNAVSLFNDCFATEARTRGNSSLPWWFDMRAMYCLCAIIRISHKLDKISPEVVGNAVQWICDSQAVLGGFGANPEAEAHGGYTFCAVASLRILNQAIPMEDRLLAWCGARSRNGKFNGRPGKPSDSCYIWWIGATTRLVGQNSADPFPRSLAIEFLLNNCFVPTAGGFSKFPSVPVVGDESSVHGKQEPDLFHTFLAVCSLALSADLIDPTLVLPLSSVPEMRKL